MKKFLLGLVTGIAVVPILQESLNIFYQWSNKKQVELQGQSIKVAKEYGLPVEGVDDCDCEEGKLKIAPGFAPYSYTQAIGEPSDDEYEDEDDEEWIDDDPDWTGPIPEYAGRKEKK